jgi:hypothetical protein
MVRSGTTVHPLWTLWTNPTSSKIFERVAPWYAYLICIVQE